MPRSHDPRPGFSRRSFLKGAGGAAATGAAGGAIAEGARAAQADERRSGTFTVRLSVNGETRAVAVEPRTTLLAALRDRLDPPLTGSKLVCDEGTCGACTVLLDGRPAYACMQLACDLEGVAVTTVEGLSEGGELSPVQRAFVEEDASMCGFCTPGFVVSVTACLERDPGAGEEEVRAACAGNLCRCGTYPHVWKAAARAGAALSGEGGR